MSFLDHSVNEFISNIDSKSPTPGGGSVSALSACLGIALARMMGHVSIGRKAFRALPKEHQEEFMQAYEELGLLLEQVRPLVDRDADAFNAVMDAHRLPKESQEERSLRLDTIQKTTIGAIEIPLHVALLSERALGLLLPLLTYGNKNASSDVKVAALELQTAINGALLNVEINLPGLSDSDKVEEYQSTIQRLRDQTTIKMRELQ